jgi:hypothetical protein
MVYHKDSIMVLWLLSDHSLEITRPRWSIISLRPSNNSYASFRHPAISYELIHKFNKFIEVVCPYYCIFHFIFSSHFLCLLIRVYGQTSWLLPSSLSSSSVNTIRYSDEDYHPTNLQTRLLKKQMTQPDYVLP